MNVSPKPLLILFVVSLAATRAHAQEDRTVPVVVTTAFAQRFPDAVSPKWDAENMEAYQVSFSRKGVKHEAAFDDSGTWLWTAAGVRLNALPQAVLETLAQQHPEARVTEAEQVEENGKDPYFEITVMEDGLEQEVFIAANGDEFVPAGDDGDEPDGDAVEDDDTGEHEQ